MSLNTICASQSRYFVQFVNSDRRGTREHYYYVNARSPEEAEQNALRGLGFYESWNICNDQTVRSAVRC